MVNLVRERKEDEREKILGQSIEVVKGERRK